jgi:NAD(P)-dependent dehydrogenase (short-subunit alcohol dehydrogenase family)
MGVERMDGRRALMTGAGSGIGRGTALLCARRCPPHDLLVDNAGVGLGASFLEAPLEDWDWILPINVMGVVHGCNVFVPAIGGARWQPRRQPLIGGGLLRQPLAGRLLGGRSRRRAVVGAVGVRVSPGP